MNTPTEPEGGKLITTGGNLLTTFIIKNNAGKPWSCSIEHNGKKILTDKDGKAILHINGGPLKIHGIAIDVQRRVQKGVNNIFQHDSSSGRIIKIEESTTDLDNTLILHHE